MGRQPARSAAATCPRCAAVTSPGASRCGICNLDLTAAADAAPATAAVEPTPPPEADIVAPEPVVEPAPEPIAVVPDAPIAVVEPEPAPEPITVVPDAPIAVVEPEPAPETVAAPMSRTAPAPMSATHRGALVGTRGLAQAVTIVAAISAVVLAGSQLFLWLAVRQTTSAFEQAFTVDANGQLSGSDPGASLASGAVLGTLAGLGILVWIGLLVATMVLLLVWQAKAMANAAVLAGRPIRYATAPALICWFVPIANLFIPWMNLKDIWTATFTATPGGRAPRSSAVVTAWWAVWIGTGLVAGIEAWRGQGSSSLGPAPMTSTDGLQSLMWLAATVLLIVVVRSISAAQNALVAPVVAPPVATSPFAGQFDAVPHAEHAPSASGTLVSASTPAPPVARVNPRDPFSWPAPQPSRPSGPMNG